MKRVIMLVTAITAVAGFASISFATTTTSCNKQTSSPIWASTAPRKVVKAKVPTKNEGTAATAKGVL